MLVKQCSLGSALVLGFALATSATYAQDAVTLNPINVEGTGSRESATGPVPGYVAHRSATGAKTNSSLLENPQSVTVVTRDQVEAQGARSVAEALRYEANVLSESRIGDRFDNVFIRGFGGFGGNANYLQFWDSLRLPRGVNYANPSVDPYLLERIEILRGPASILYGQNNPGGLINLVSKKPTETPFREVMVRAGDHGRIEGGFDVGGPLDKEGRLLYRFIGLGRYAENEVDYTTSERRLFAPSLTFRPSMGTTLTVRANFQYDPASFQPNWLPALGTLQPNPNGQIPRSLFSGHPAFNLYSRVQNSAGYEFEHQFDQVWTVRQNLRYMHVESDFKAVSVTAGGPSPGGYVPAAMCGGVANRCLNRTSTHFVEALNALTIDNQAEAKFSTGILKHTALFGVDYQWSSAVSRGSNLGGPGAAVNPPLDYLNPNYGAAPADPTLAFLTDQKREQVGIYAQDQIRLDNWAFVFGIRNDHSDQSTQSRNVSGVTQAMVIPAGAVVGVAQPSDSATTWRAGVTYLFESGLAPYINYSTSFEPTLGTDASGTAFVPTTGEQIEAGLKYEPAWFNGHFLFSVFDLRQHNVLMQDPANAANLASACTVQAGFCQLQVGEVRSRGVEFSFKANPVAGLDVVGSVGYTDIQITESPTDPGLIGNAPVGAPSTTAALWADYTLQRGSLAGFGFGGGVRYVGESYGDAINSPAMVVPAYTLVDAALHYDLTPWGARFKDWRVALNVNNVFDKDYVSGCASTTQCFYGAGRSVLASARFRW